MTTNLADLERERVKPQKLRGRPTTRFGWVLFVGDAAAIIVSWFAYTSLFFLIPIYTVYQRAESIEAIELVSGARWICVTLVLFLLAVRGHYSDRIHYFFQFGSAFSTCLIGLVSELILRQYLGTPFSFTGVVLAWLVITTFLIAFRVGTANLIVSRRHFLKPINVAGSGSMAKHLVEAIERKPKHGFRVAETQNLFSSENWEEALNAEGFDLEGIAGQSLRELSANITDDALIIFPLDGFNLRNVRSAVQYFEKLNMDYGFITSELGVTLPGFKAFQFFGEDLTLLLPDSLEPPLWTRVTKRLLDCLISLILIFLLSPLLCILSGLIKLDGGPVFFRHTRIGRGFVLFDCLKFRSMVIGAEEVLEEHLNSNPAARREWENTHKLKNDPRITRVGKFLRKTSLDELPQVFNIVRGEMSLVGPRPIVHNEMKKYEEEIVEYARVRPGVTGLWQVSGRNNTSYKERVELDKWYVRNWSLWLDLFILVKTVPIVLTHRGAY